MSVELHHSECTEKRLRLQLRELMTTRCWIRGIIFAVSCCSREAGSVTISLSSRDWRSKSLLLTYASNTTEFWHVGGQRNTEEAPVSVHYCEVNSEVVGLIVGSLLRLNKRLKFSPVNCSVISRFPTNFIYGHSWIPIYPGDMWIQLTACRPDDRVMHASFKMMLRSNGTKTT